MQDVFNKDVVKIWSNKPKRDFIFTEDAADAVLRIINTNFTGIINLGAGKMVSLAKICEIVEGFSNKKNISEDKKVSGPMEFITDIQKIRLLTGWSTKFYIFNGLKKTYEIMKKYNEET